MMKVLLANQRRIMLNTIKSQPLKNYVGFFVSVVVMGILVYLFSKGIWSVADTMKDSVFDGLLSYGFLFIMGFIILLGLPYVYKNLYAATDLGLLFTMPIPTKHIFWVKYLQTFLGVPLYGFLLFVIPLCVYGMATNVSVLYYPVAFIVLLAVILIGLSIAYLANLIVIQIVPASKANEFVTVMSFLAGLFVYVMIMLPSLVNDQSMEEMVLEGLPLFPEWTPMRWGSAAIMDAAGGSFNFALPFMLLVLLAIFIMALTSTLVERGFRTGWIRLSEGGSKKKKKKRTSKMLSHPVIAVGKKEWFTIKRDLREWLVFMPIGMFVVFGLIGFFSGGGNISDIRSANDVSWPIAQGLLLFLYGIFNGNMAASSVGREGPSEWILRVLPLSGEHIAMGKLWISWLIPFILLSVIEIIGGILMGWTVWQFIFGFFIKAFITLGMSAVGLWLGTLGAKYNPTNPQQRLNFGISLIMLLLSYVYLLILLIPIGYAFFPIDQVELPTNMNHGMTGFKGVLADTWLSLLSLKMNYPEVMTFVGVLMTILLSIGVVSLLVSVSAKRFDKGVKIDMVSDSNSKALFGKKKPGQSLK